MMALVTCPIKRRVAALLALAVVCVNGHGTLYEPPSRGTLYLFGFDSPQDYDHYGNNCGGLGTQYSENDGNCGVCGDPYQQPQPRDHENGGKYGLGILPRTYSQGQTIPVSVYISVSHKGEYSFSLCPLSDPSKPATEDCFDRHPVRFADGATSRPVPRDIGSGSLNSTLVLPPDVSCKQCVLRWKYRGGNNWGCDALGKCCTGCGWMQEEFYACSDITIRASGVPVTQLPPATQTPPPTVKPRPVIPTLFPPYVVEPAPSQTDKPVSPVFPTPAPRPPGTVFCPSPFCRIVCRIQFSCPSHCPTACRLFTSA